MNIKLISKSGKAQARQEKEQEHFTWALFGGNGLAVKPAVDHTEHLWFDAKKTVRRFAQKAEVRKALLQCRGALEQVALPI
jgi:hypothetical protein